MTIWPRKHKRKTPSQAFTRSKQIYRIGWSLKFCGTVHYRHVMYIHTAKLSQSRLNIMIIFQIAFHLETSLCMYLVQPLTLVGLINHEADARSNYPCRPPPDCDDVSPSVSYPVCTGMNSLWVELRLVSMGWNQLDSIHLLNLLHFLRFNRFRL